MEDLRVKCSSLEQVRDKDDKELTTKNEKLERKLDKYKTELGNAKRDISTLQSQLQQTRQDKVVSHTPIVQKLLFNSKKMVDFGSSIILVTRCEARLK